MLSHPSPRKQVRNLGLVLGSALLIALVAIWFWSFRSDSTGVYKAENILLSPDWVQKLSSSENNPTMGTAGQVILSDLQWVSIDGATGQKRAHTVTLAAYTRFYAAVKEFESVEESPRDFERGNRASLLFSLRTAQQSGGDAIFQEVQFVEGPSLFRVELVAPGSSRTWAYFSWINGYEEAEKLLIVGSL